MQGAKKRTITVKDKLDDDRIDLSLMELTDAEVPVKQLVKNSK